MRTTAAFDDDRGSGQPVESPVHAMGIGIDVRNVAEAIEAIEQHDGLLNPLEPRSLG